MVLKKKALDDVWSYQQNHYVALWYRHGTPVMGRAWNDSGVVQCEFAVDKKVFVDTEVGGTIQLLTYNGTHESNSYFYEWVPVSLWKSEYGKELAIRQVVRCGNSAPIYWPEAEALGNYHIDTQKALFPIRGQCQEVTDLLVLSRLMVLVRNTEGGPPHCPCNTCNQKQKPSQKPLMVNEWSDFLYGIQWPMEKPLVKAMERPLKTPKGAQEHIVALWYRHGSPIMGRAWNEAGKMQASFTANGREYTGETVGSLQALVKIAATAAGFDYIWMPYEQASKYQDKDYCPVHISHVAPCVLLTKENCEVLGQVDLKKERAEAAFRGEMIVREGPLQLNHLMVLCRRDRDDTFTI